MKLNVNLSNLRIETSKMQGLEGLVKCLRDEKLSYQNGLSVAVEYTQQNSGIVETLEDGVTRLALHGFEVHCFQPYSDIDLFYYEF